MGNSVRSCCFTGHRVIRAEDHEDLAERVRVEIRRLAESGIENFIAGGALGFDMIAAREVVSLREWELPGITLELILPCENQHVKWRAAEQQEYMRILAAADKVSYISKEYTPVCMQMRNRAMVDASEHCIAYIYRSFGGTAATVRYANECDKELTLL